MYCRAEKRLRPRRLGEVTILATEGDKARHKSRQDPNVKVAPRGSERDAPIDGTATTQPTAAMYTQIMKRTQRLTAIIEREDDGFVSLCPELDIASQGASIEEARANLVEALTLFFETADPSEVERRYHGDVLVTQVEVPVG